MASASRVGRLVENDPEEANGDVPRLVLCFEHRCSKLHRVSPSATMSWGCQAALSRSNRIIRRCSGIRDHSLLKDFRCCVLRQSI